MCEHPRHVWAYLYRYVLAEIHTASSLPRHTLSYDCIPAPLSPPSDNQIASYLPRIAKRPAIRYDLKEFEQ